MTRIVRGLPSIDEIVDFFKGEKSLSLKILGPSSDAITACHELQQSLGLNEEWTRQQDGKLVGRLFKPGGYRPSTTVGDYERLAVIMPYITAVESRPDRPAIDISNMGGLASIPSYRRKNALRYDPPARPRPKPVQPDPMLENTRRIRLDR